MLQQRITYGTIFSGVEHVIDKDDCPILSLLQLQKKKKELVVKARAQLADIKELKSFFQSQKHLFLIVNNQQVLSKEIGLVNENQIKILQSAFPNIVLSDFYYQVYGNDKSSFVAICRKEYIDELIDEYLKNGIFVIGFSLGNLGLESALPFIKEEVIVSSNSRIVLVDNQITNIDKLTIETARKYSINNLEISNNELLPLSGVLSYFFNKENHQLGLAEKRVELQESYQQKRIFYLGIITALGVLFTILLINFFLFSNYHNKNNALITEVELNESYKNQLLKLQQKVTKKERLVSNLDAVSNSKVSLYLDEIARQVPNTIMFSVINYQPIKSKIKIDRPIVVDSHQIVIKGETKKNDAFTDFIDVLERKDWVERVVILNFGKKKNSNTSFECLIYLNHE